MTVSPWTKVRKYLRYAGQWFRDTPDRALEQAYDAALSIKAIEDEHFSGQKISAESGRYGESVQTYFDTELKKYLKFIQMRLVEFNMSRSMLTLPAQEVTKSTRPDIADPTAYPVVFEAKDETSPTFEKLAFIDSVISKYLSNKKSATQNRTTMIPVADSPNSSFKPISSGGPATEASNSGNSPAPTSNKNLVNRIDTSADEVSLLPRSLLGTLNRITRELDPDAEKEVIKNFRNSKVKTIVSIRFILLLILIPLLTQQLSKNFVVGPIVDQIKHQEDPHIFLNLDLQKEAFQELHQYEEKLRFEVLVGIAPPLTDEQRNEAIKDKAEELAEEYRKESADAIKNIFADVVSCVVFALIIFRNKKELEVLKSFMDDVIYGLSDSAKAFIIILFTDMFVGFHSPHGWEVILEGISRHLGLPENRQFIYLFIATFPVILDAVFKYWIFRYLNRSSPSAVATYKNMNE